MTNEDIITKAQNYMKHFHKDDTTGHDIAHIQRVTRLAEYIANNEQQGHLLTIQLASILHDTIDNKLTNTKEAKVKLAQFLNGLELDHVIQQNVLHIIEHISYKNGKNDHVKLSIEGQIVRDADRLDAIGAIGIARTFQFAGHFGEPMWIDQQSNNIKKSNQSYFDWKPSAIKHFYEKLFKLKSLMHTQTAKNLAQQRHEFMKNYVDTFFKEWYF
ncbi:HD domain-containing protein [Staphylococcus ureilyticus]|uniref:HD domain-containing protein n=1 Tax=Staphylococcus ureilyticus TaxID=94138 RepID=UPI0021D138D1|nr:HD domain-containing protein [Staphylococcus ureilyticus]UXS59195.1 HD domain-containing protein [Staphylococcus ureilyticus]